MRALILLMPFAANAFGAGPLILGARGGVPFANTNDAVVNAIGGLGDSQTYKIGPTVGVKLPLGFSVEGDALFTRQTLRIGAFGGFGGLSTNSDAWEFPVMLKFTAGRSTFAPVIGAGVAVRRTNQIADIPSYLLNGSRSANSAGFVAGGGVRFGMGPVAVTPELRYTYWTAGSGWRDSLMNLLPWTRHEASLLVGLTF
jgi:hypothetical protein